MTDFSAPVSAPVTATAATPPTSGTLLAYALFAIAGVVALVHSGFPPIAPLFGLIGIIAVIVCYVKRDEAAGTWVASHLRWLIRTFWFSLFWTMVGWIFFVVLFIIVIGPVIAICLWGATAIWILYRVIRGYLIFQESRPVPGM